MEVRPPRHKTDTSEGKAAGGGAVSKCIIIGSMSDARTRHTLPKTVAYVALGDGPRTLPGLLLTDFEDALEAYAQMGGVPAPRRVEDASSCDALVVAACANDLSGLEGLLPAGGARSYALLAHEGTDPGLASRAQERLEEQLARRDAGLAGCALIPLASRLERHMGCARMGHARRNVSEATDDLVLALRCGAACGTIPVRPPSPAFLWRLLDARGTRDLS